jgi:hypothetical protein
VVFQVSHRTRLVSVHGLLAAQGHNHCRAETSAAFWSWEGRLELVFQPSSQTPDRGRAEPVDMYQAVETDWVQTKLLDSRTEESARTVLVLLDVARIIRLGAARCVAIPANSVHQYACPA